MQSVGTEPVTFDSAGSKIAGILYRPMAGSTPMPCVVMAQGFSGTMDWIVPDFAATFAGGGFAVLTFDYRHLGKSEGEPRQLITCAGQREDLRRAVEFVRSHPAIDSSRIALWGTSLGGSHVITLAAQQHDFAAVVANVPGLDLFKGIRGRYVPPHLHLSKLQITVATLRLLAAAGLDAVRGALGLSPYYLAVYGRLGHAVFFDPSLADLFRDVEDKAPTWRNRFTPRFLFSAPRYREGTMERIAAPLMVTLARDDEVISSSYVKTKAVLAARHEIREYPVRHFEMYHGEVRD